MSSYQLRKTGNNFTLFKETIHYNVGELTPYGGLASLTPVKTFESDRGMMRIFRIYENNSELGLKLLFKRKGYGLSI